MHLFNPGFILAHTMTTPPKDYLAARKRAGNNPETKPKNIERYMAGWYRAGDKIKRGKK